MGSEASLNDRVGLAREPRFGTDNALEVFVGRHSAASRPWTEIPSLPTRGRDANQMAADEDMLPFAPMERSGWGGPGGV